MADENRIPDTNVSEVGDLQPGVSDVKRIVHTTIELADSTVGFTEIVEEVVIDGVPVEVRTPVKGAWDQYTVKSVGGFGFPNEEVTEESLDATRRAVLRPSLLGDAALAGALTDGMMKAFKAFDDEKSTSRE